MWTSGLDWDEILEDDLVTKAQAWFNQFENLNKVRVPRCLQWGQEEQVSPLKLMSIPRLKLMSAVLGVQFRRGFRS